LTPANPSSCTSPRHGASSARRKNPSWRRSRRNRNTRLTIFDVDFDTQKDALRVLKIQTQSTLAVFKAKAEVSRAVGITRRDAIEAVMKQAL